MTAAATTVTDMSSALDSFHQRQEWLRCLALSGDPWRLYGHGQGIGVTREPGTARFARRSMPPVSACWRSNCRRIGESGGQPCQEPPVCDQFADWAAATDAAAALM